MLAAIIAWRDWLNVKDRERRMDQALEASVQETAKLRELIGDIK